MTLFKKSAFVHNINIGPTCINTCFWTLPLFMSSLVRGVSCKVTRCLDCVFKEFISRKY